MKKLCSFLFLTLFATALAAQLEVSSSGPNSNPENLVRNILAGPGVQIYNISSYGNAEQYGFFTKGQELGLDSGVVLSTGLAAAAASSYVLSGPEADFAFNKQSGQGEGDDDLLAIAKETAVKLGNNQPPRTHDAASIAFEFEPESDTVVFNFVFGSEEYPDYVNSQFNDAFGFFVAGPGYSGPYSAPAQFTNGAANLAKVPNEDLAITVSTINDGRNAGLYVSNANKTYSTHYNGFTKVLTVRMGLVPCQRYYFRFAIADGTANNFDSGIFIGAGGFSTEKFAIEKTASFVKTENEFEEGCGTVRLSYTRLGGLNFTDSLRLEVDAASTASLADISGFVPLLVFKPGEKRKDIVFQIPDDGLAEGREQLIVKGTLLNGCIQPVYTNFDINDYEEHKLNNPGNEQVNFACAGDSFRIGASPSLGSGFYRFQWLRNNIDIQENSDSIYAFPANGNTKYEVRVWDSCSSKFLTKTWDFVFVPAGNMDVYAGSDTSFDCAGVSFTIIPDSVVGGAAPFSYTWKNEVGDVISQNRSFSYTAEKSDSLTLTVEDRCGFRQSDYRIISVNNGATLQIGQSPRDTTVCAGEPVPLSWYPISGSGNYTAAWGDGMGANQNPRVFRPSKDSLVNLRITDKCNNQLDLEYRITVNQPFADFEIFYSDNKLRVENYSRGTGLSYRWLVDSSLISTEEIPDLSLGDYFDHNLVLILRDKDGCIDVAEQVFGPPLPIYVPNAFTPDADAINDTWEISAPKLDRFLLQIFDRFGNKVFESKDQYDYWDGILQNTGRAVRGTYIAKIIAERGTQRFEFLVQVKVIL